ncbi:MAG TPA: LysE family translocator [Actinomycetota bacterium]
MPEVQTLTVFAAAALLFAVVPGPAVIYIVTRSVDQGRAAGLVSALGIATGTLVHVPFAAVGLSALLVSSAVAFTTVKYLGAAYLVYLGIRKLLDKETDDLTVTVATRSLKRVFSQGVVVGVLNPKTALFFLAFLPQFVDPARGSAALQLGVLGVLLVAISMVSDSGYALLTGTAGEWLRGRSKRFVRRQRVLTGSIYIALGLSAAVAGTQTNAD